MADPADGRQRIPALSRFEEEAKFTRAIRVGDRIIVSGNVGGEADGTISPDAGRQAERCFEQILEYVSQLGGQSGDVVRVRMFVTDIADAQAVTAAYGSNQGALSMVFAARQAELEAQRKLLNLQKDLARTLAQLNFKPLKAQELQ